MVSDVDYIVRFGSSGSDSTQDADPRELVEALREYAGLTADSSVDDVLENVWEAILAQFGELSPDLTAKLAQLRTADRMLLATGRRHSDVSGRMADAVAQLEAAPCSVAELVSLAPRLICELGFDRAIVSRVDDGIWVPETVYIPGQREWAEEICQSGQQNPQRLGRDIHETELVRRRECLLVTDVQSDQRVNRPIADSSRSRSYVAAPLTSHGQVIGMLHADRYRRQRDVDGDDCQVLNAFAQSLRLALSRAHLSQQVADLRVTLENLTDALSASVRDSHTLSIRRAAAQAPSEAANSEPIVRTSQSKRIAAANLTAREREILSLIAQGRTNASIARHLVIAEGTVKQHVKNVLRKLRASNRAEATALWFAREDEG